MKYEEVKDEEIRLKYLKPPTLQQIKDFVESQNVSYSQFERFYRIPAGVLRQVKMGNRDLPVKFWAIFYERLTPTYGTSFKEINKIVFKKKTVTKFVTQLTSDNTNSRISNRLEKAS